ncbi:MAG: glycoside hydrolase family 3 C-terminal domain-containing protein [Bacteroidales bacterium]|nr:glycoside hydrolase family 3 C-terminal domain-containing protein [Bacteroidales bacterium]
MRINALCPRLGLVLFAGLLIACQQAPVKGKWTLPQEELVEVSQTLGCADATAEPNQWLAFRKDMTLDAVPSSALARISVDSKYWLWVNGKLVVFEGGLKRGPNPQDSYYDQLDLAPYLQKGENQIALLLWYFGKDAFSHLGSGKPQLWFDCPALPGGEWLCRVHPAYGTATDLPKPNYRLPESSIAFDARADIEAWQTGSLEGFAPAVKLESTLGKLHLRPIPQWKDYGVKDVDFVTHTGPGADTLVALLPHNMQMTPVMAVEDAEGGHRIVIETDHAKVGEQCLRAEYITKAGRQEYESLGWLSGQKLILTVEHGARVSALKYRETGYDTAPDGHFTCSDEFFNRFWQKGLRTIYVNSRDSFFDCPDRERAQWWGDIVTILGESFYTYSPSLFYLIRKGIRELVDWQRPDDILFSPIPGNYGVELPCQMLAAVGRYGIWTYYMNTGDLETIRHAFPIIKKYLATYHEGPDGLIAWHDGDWNWGDWGSNRDMRLLQNLWYVLALQGLSDMADIVGEEGEGGAIWARMAALRDAINRVTWTGSAYRHPEYEGETDDRVNALAVLSGVASRDKYDALFQVLKSEEHASPYMEKYVMEALFAMGHGDYALERERRRYEFMVNHSFHDTLFENWNVGVDGDWNCGSVNHAWSGGPLAVFPTRMFGVVPTEPGWKTFSVTLDKHIFDQCSLSFPTVAGTVSLAYDAHARTLEVEVPKGTRADVSIPWAMVRSTLGPGRHTVKLEGKPEQAKGKLAYQDPKLPVEKRVCDLMKRMSTEEKVAQLSAQLLFDDEFYEKRDYKAGHVRNVGHFMPNASPSAVAEAINQDTRLSMEASRWGIPVLQHGEALHGAQWGNATCFPQSIAMGATFDDNLYYSVGQVVAEELRAVGVRQVYAPVINITRDQRWGRGQESYGEDVLLNSRMGVAYVKALQEGGVVATPKHFVDNYGEGGHDSFASITSWRELREVYLEPFRACFQEGGARSVMSAYNSVDGVPSSCNSVLLQDILKKEWGFEGYVVSDYGAVEIVHGSHRMAASEDDALALCLENGLDLQLANTSTGLAELVRSGKVSPKTLDEAVRRILKVKFELGLFDQPFVEADKAPGIVRSAEHRELAYESACKAMTLLKNDGILPLKGGRRIGLFGPAADQVNLGDYSGGYGGWHGDGAISPYEGLKAAFPGEVVLGQDVSAQARSCDVLLFFPTIAEEEGSDRSSFRLPSAQEEQLRKLIATGKPVVVVLHNGAVIEISDWVDGVSAVLEAWYPGEQGGRAIADVLTGAVNPGGRLPFSWVRTIGQNPYYYSIKPSGRGYGYVENDGSPLYPFGYGLSYTTFEYRDFQLPSELKAGENLKVKVTVTNTGSVAGDEVVQLYAHDELASVARPLKQLVAFKRVTLAPGESREVELEVPYRQFGLWDQKMQFGVEEGWFEMWLGRNANDRIDGGRVYVK